MNINRLTHILAIAILFSAADAQIPGMPGSAGDPAGQPLTLLQNKELQSELKLDGKQRAELARIKKELDQAMTKMATEAQRDQSKMMEAYSNILKLSEEANKTALGVLNGDQSTRFGEIQLQVKGALAVAETEVATALELSDEQLAHVKSIASDYRSEALRLLSRGGMGGDPRKAIRLKREESEAAIIKELTSAQAEKFKGMQGKPFPSAAKLRGPI
jgi:hypothetical protein